MRVGIKILDQAQYRNVLDDGFDRLGFQLANSDVDEELYRTHFCHLTPRGAGGAYLLKFTKGPDSDWDSVTLLDAATNGVLASCSWESVVDDPTADSDRRWAESIIRMCAQLFR